ncbi:hypothetical protein ACWDSD_39990, partial [Streptomyces spiralis]
MAENELRLTQRTASLLLLEVCCLQEGRHSPARKIFHRRHGQLYQRYQDGREDQIGTLALARTALD